ncbi:hypothetical protein EON66_11090 [archaeon]|nr:MAG: hypothetical protein EON66_11090 [archaeon]
MACGGMCVGGMSSGRIARARAAPRVGSAVRVHPLTFTKSAAVAEDGPVSSMRRLNESASKLSSMYRYLHTLARAPSTSARYCVYDHPYTTPDGRKTDKLFLILWSPLAATGRSKMFYTSQKQSLSKVFTGVEDAQCSNASEVMTLLGAAPEEEDDAWDPDA